MRAWDVGLAILTVTLLSSTAGAAGSEVTLRPGSWKGEGVTRVGGGNAVASAVMAIAGRIPLTKCIPPDLASGGPIAVLRDGSECEFKVTDQSNDCIRADQVCRDASGKPSISKVVVQSSPEKMIVTINGEAGTPQKSIPMTITDTLSWAGSSCG